MRKILTLILAAVCLFLCSCGSNRNKSVPSATSDIVYPTVEPIEEITAEPTPAPTPEPEIEINGEKVKASTLEAGYIFDLFGQEVNTLTTDRLEYSLVNIGDDGLDTFRTVLPYMKALEYLSFDRCDMSDEKVAQLREDFPDIKIVWRVFFGPFSCFTDEETIWASCDLRDEQTEALRYCNDVKNLDVGHCTLTDYWFLEYMPNLEVLIISCGDVEDVTQIGEYCHNLIFLEAAEDRIVDVSPIAKCTSLVYLNVGGNQYMDFDTLSSLYTLPNLKRFFCQNYMNINVNMEEEEEKVQELMPDTEVDFFVTYENALNEKWRYTKGMYQGDYNEMYQWIRDIFGYDDPYGQSRLY